MSKPTNQHSLKQNSEDELSKKLIKEAKDALFGEPKPDPTVEPEENLKIKVLEKAIDQTYNTENINVKSELNRRQVVSFAKNELFSDYFVIPIAKSLTKNIMENSLSLNRASRKEFKDIITAGLQTTTMEDMNRTPSIPDKLLGRRR